MPTTDRTPLFDKWARNYDPDLKASQADFPFTGYERVLDDIVVKTGSIPGLRILDLGIGTGNLAERFVRQGCDVWGIDFSSEMLAKAQAKLPQAHLLHANLKSDWPAQLPPSFDRVVSSYVLHEFDMPTKIKLLKRMAECLTSQGVIVIGDIAFPNIAIREEAASCWAHSWDPDEYYWAADETSVECELAGLKATYRQVSSCGGVFTF